MWCPVENNSMKTVNSIVLSCCLRCSLVVLYKTPHAQSFTCTHRTLQVSVVRTKYWFSVQKQSHDGNHCHHHYCHLTYTCQPGWGKACCWFHNTQTSGVWLIHAWLQNYLEWYSAVRYHSRFSWSQLQKELEWCCTAKYQSRFLCNWGQHVELSSLTAVWCKWSVHYLKEGKAKLRQVMSSVAE